MKSFAMALALAGCVVAPHSGFAQKLNSDDVKWINQCIDDNKGEASDAIIRKYLRLHEREDGFQRNPVDHRVGKVEPAGARRL